MLSVFTFNSAMKGVFCTTCDGLVPGGIEEFKRHILKRNHVAPYTCAEGKCRLHGRTFQHKTSLVRHLRESHPEGSTLSSENSESAVLPGLPYVETDPSGFINLPSTSQCFEEEIFSGSTSPAADQEPIQESSSSSFTAMETESNVERAAALFLLNLKKRGNVPGTAINLVIQEVTELLAVVIDNVKKRVSANLKDHGIDDKIIEASVQNVSYSDPFKNLQSKEQQLKYFMRNFNLVRPESKLIGYRYDQRLDDIGIFQPTQVPSTFQYISLISTLSVVLNNPILYDYIHSEKKSTDGCLRSFCDGMAAKLHFLVSKFPHALRLVLYADDFECVNPLGSKTSVHKIVGVYFTIQNLPSAENSKLRSIHVSSYAYREDLPKDRGIDVLLEPFFSELEQLECENGIDISVNGAPYKLRATLVACAADTLACHEMLGLQSPSALRFCSLCLVSKEEFHGNILAMGEKRTKDLHNQHVAEVTSTGSAAVKKYYGVNRDCLLIKKPKFSEFPEAIIKDGMHDLLKGVVPMELKLSLYEFCIVKKYFDVEFLNASIETFNYGVPDMKNKPSANFTRDSISNISTYSLHQTAAQTWCLLRIFPFLISHKVPENCPHLQLIVLLKRISDIIFSSIVSENDILLLENLLLQHHSLFCLLYPPETEEEHEDTVDSNILDQEPDFREGIASGSDAVPQNPAEKATSSKRANPNRKKTIRPVNKHHHLLHYPDMMRKYGPAVLYWCMRYEGKHALAKRFAAICCNYKNLPLTLANIHQINHAAELLELKEKFEERIVFSQLHFLTVGTSEHTKVLCDAGFKEEDVIFITKSVTVGGFHYREGLYVALPLAINNLPMFGLISSIYKCQKDVLHFITQDVKVLKYDFKYGAYLIDPIPDLPLRVSTISGLLPCKPMCVWNPGNTGAAYLSPRNTLSDT